MQLYTPRETTGIEMYQDEGDIGFTDVASAQMDTFAYEDLSNSRERNLDQELWKELHKIDALSPETFGPKYEAQTNEHAPDILKQAWAEKQTLTNKRRVSDWDAMVEPNLAELQKRFPDANIRDRDQIDLDIAEQAKVRREEFEKAYSYADPYAALFGTFGGAALASMADPINMMTMPLGVGKVAAGSFLKTIGVVAARSFAIGATTEAAIQPFVYNYKQDIKSPYELTDALFNMAAGGIGQGLLSGAGHAIGKGFDRLVGKNKLPDTHENRQLAADIETLREMNVFADETGAKTPAELEIHLNALNRAMADVESGNKIDYDALGKGIERQYLETFEAEVNQAQQRLDHLAQKRQELEQATDIEISDKQQKIKALDVEHKEAVKIHSESKQDLAEYVEENQVQSALKISATDTPRMKTVKAAVTRIVKSMGANDIKVKVYEGNPDVDGDMRYSMDDGKGSPAWEAAKAKGLDMSQTGRMARAKEMGFDTGTVYYHGTPDSREIWKSGFADPFKGMRAESPPFFFSSERRVAATYADDSRAFDYQNSEPEVIPVRLRMSNPKRLNWGGRTFRDAQGTLEDAINKAKQEGHDGVIIDNIRDDYDANKRGTPSNVTVVFDSTNIRSVNAAFNPNSIDSPDLLASKQGKTIEAAINPETGELHVNASAFRDDAHLMEVIREEVIGHYGLRKVLGDEFQGVIDAIKSSSKTNQELAKLWGELSGVDPKTNKVINENAAYKGMADDVIADEIISKMARNELSDSALLKLKNIIIKALRSIGLVKDDITISEMKALVIKSEKSLKKNVTKQPTITGLKPKQRDEVVDDSFMEAEATRIMADETEQGVIFDNQGNTVSLRDSLLEDQMEISGIEAIKVCML